MYAQCLFSSIHFRTLQSYSFILRVTNPYACTSDAGESLHVTDGRAGFVADSRICAGITSFHGEGVSNIDGHFSTVLLVGSVTCNNQLSFNTPSPDAVIWLAADLQSVSTLSYFMIHGHTDTHTSSMQSRTGAS